MTEAQRFQRGEVLGRGGMATVYRAYDQVAQMEVALKVLHPHLSGDDGMEEAFLREAAVMRAIDSPGVVRIFETLRVEGRPAIAMELCEGGDLRERIARHGPLDENQARTILIEVLQALEVVHDEGIVHRDIKPHNILFDAQDRPRIIDFGIGQAQELLASEDSGQMGTVEYMAPERIDGLAIDGRSDLYSAGVMLFEMLCGHPPFRSPSAAAVMRMHREAPRPDPRAFDQTIGEGMAQVVMRAMARHPEERFDSATEMIQALRGEIALAESLALHPTWEKVRDSQDELGRLAADVEQEGYEWLVLTSPQRRDEAAKAKLDQAVVELVEEHREFATISAIGLELRRQFFSTNHSDALGLHHSVPRPQLTSQYGIARGLSRTGAQTMIEALGDAGEVVRIARRPRRRRHQGVVRQVVRSAISLSIVTFAITWMTLIFSMLLLAGSVPMALQSPTMIALYAGLVGALVGWIGISGDFREWWLTRVTTSYLLDFAAPPRAATDAVLDRAVGLLEELRSPRVKASLERAFSASLHLEAFADEAAVDTAGIGELREQILSIAEEVRTAEQRLAVIRPGELTRQIRRLDEEIATSEEVEATDELMTQRRTLREQLVARDDALLLLQTRAQRLHELSGQIEHLARNHREVSFASPARGGGDLQEEMARLMVRSASSSGD